jgi:hypothetical protein
MAGINRAAWQVSLSFCSCLPEAHGGTFAGRVFLQSDVRDVAASMHHEFCLHGGSAFSMDISQKPISEDDLLWKCAIPCQGVFSGASPSLESASNGRVKEPAASNTMKRSAAATPQPQRASTADVQAAPSTPDPGFQPRQDRAGGVRPSEQIDGNCSEDVGSSPGHPIVTAAAASTESVNPMLSPTHWLPHNPLVSCTKCFHCVVGASNLYTAGHSTLATI